MLRLYSSFAHGAPGAGLLILRAASGATLVLCTAAALGHWPGVLPALLDIGTGAIALLLLIGLWTPVAGVLAAVVALWGAYLDSSRAGNCLLLAALGIALALLGPGAFSVDARLFGWKRVEIRKSRETPPD